MTRSPAISTPEGGKTRRIYLLLRDTILNGLHAPGLALPGELQLAKTHGVSRVTIRRALDALVTEGLIERRAGSGTIAREPASMPQQIRADFATLMPQIRQMGEATSVRLLSFSYTVPPPVIADSLGLPPGVRVQHAVRLRLNQGQPFSHLTTYVPEDIAGSFNEADLATKPLYMLLEQSGQKIDHAHQTVSAVLAAPDVADALETEVGAALIALTRIVRDETGRGIEYLAAFYRPDRFRLEMTLNRVGREDAPLWQAVPQTAER